jgi:hypothetical protein
LLTTEEISFAMFHQLFFFFVCLLSAMNGGSTATKWMPEILDFTGLLGLIC